MNRSEVEIVSFDNSDKKRLRAFVDFHWKHYETDPQFVPLLDYEYLGFSLIGMTGFFEPKNLFFKHTDMRFFLAYRNGEPVGRCNAFVNHNHNRHWKDKVGFFGQFETIEEQTVTDALIAAASEWLKRQGMRYIRGPQNLPVNEATPGVLTHGFDTRPVIYYHYNKPYYADMIEKAGFEKIKRVKSWEFKVGTEWGEKAYRVADKVIKRYGVTIETWDQRSTEERTREMFEIYNDAWTNNWGFVPFTREEFETNIKDMQLILKPGLFLFLYVKGEPAAFFGAVPNIFEVMKPLSWCRRCEFLRAAKMLLLKNRVKGYRFGYMGVKRKFQRLGLDSIMLVKQKKYTEDEKYEYADIGWVLEDNVLVTRVLDWAGADLSKIYTLYQMPVD
jgi:hypothetical protein